MPEAIHVVTRERYNQMVAAVQSSRLVAIDLETTGLDPLRDSILLLALCTQDSRRWVVAFSDFGFCNSLRQEIAAPGKVLIAHNANFEYRFLRTHQCEVQQWWCTQVAEGLIQAGLREGATEDGDDRVPLSEVRQKYLGLSTDKSLQTSFVGENPAAFQPTEAQVLYAAQDVEGLHQVMEAQVRVLSREGMLRVARLEMAVLPALADMELSGFYLDLDAHAEVLRTYVEEESTRRQAVEGMLAELYYVRVRRWNIDRAAVHAALTEDINSILPGGRAKRDSKQGPGTPPDVMERVRELRRVRDQCKPLPLDSFNLNSSQQVWEALAEAGVELYKQDWDEDAADYITKKTTDKNVVKEAAAKPDALPVLAEYAAWAKAAKVVSTYGESLRSKATAGGRIHTQYNQNVSSGRTSSRGPNMQNMPPAIRGCFKASPGHVLVVADAANQEGRLAAILSGDVNLLTAFREGKDWHKMTAALAYPEKFKSWEDVPKDSPERAGCKNANFSGIYGGTGKTLVSRGYVPNLQIGERLMEASYAFAPEVRATALRSADHAVENGWVATISGRRRYFKANPKPEYAKKDSKAYRRWAKRNGGIRRAAMNHPVQGSGADIMKQAMVLLWQPMRGIMGRLVAMVHDELVYEVPVEYAEVAAELVATKMEEAASCFTSVLPIPAEVHVTKEWKK